MQLLIFAHRNSCEWLFWERNLKDPEFSSIPSEVIFLQSNSIWSPFSPFFSIFPNGGFFFCKCVFKSIFFVKDQVLFQKELCREEKRQAFGDSYKFLRSSHFLGISGLINCPWIWNSVWEQSRSAFYRDFGKSKGCRCSNADVSYITGDWQLHFQFQWLSQCCLGLYCTN